MRRSEATARATTVSFPSIIKECHIQTALAAWRESLGAVQQVTMTRMACLAIASMVSLSRIYDTITRCGLIQEWNPYVAPVSTSPLA